MSDADIPEALDRALEAYAALEHPLERLIVAVTFVGAKPDEDAQTWSLLGHQLRPDVGRAINYQRVSLPESRARVNGIVDRIGASLPDPYDSHDLLERLQAAELVREVEDWLRSDDEPSDN